MPAKITDNMQWWAAKASPVMKWISEAEALCGKAKVCAAKSTAAPQVLCVDDPLNPPCTSPDCKFSTFNITSPLPKGPGHLTRAIASLNTNNPQLLGYQLTLDPDDYESFVSTVVGLSKSVGKPSSYHVAEGEASRDGGVGSLWRQKRPRPGMLRGVGGIHPTSP